VNPAPASNGTARRLRNSSEKPAARTVVMTVIVCSQCGQRFSISHDLISQDAELAERQGTWLRDRFVWDHIQESKHKATIALPGSAEIT
jgi:hypothetical protein